MNNEYWRDAEDDENLICRSVSADGRIHVGLYRVLFGWRVRGGWVNDKWGVALDWCCGADHGAIYMGYKLMLAAIQSSADCENPFEALPASSEFKPFTHDKEMFFKAVREIKPGVFSQLNDFSLPTLIELDLRRTKQFEKIMSNIEGEVS